MPGTTVVITGATAGIGKVAAPGARKDPAIRDRLDARLRDLVGLADPRSSAS